MNLPFGLRTILLFCRPDHTEVRAVVTLCDGASAYRPIELETPRPAGEGRPTEHHGRASAATNSAIRGAIPAGTAPWSSPAREELVCAHPLLRAAASARRIGRR